MVADLGVKTGAEWLVEERYRWGRAYCLARFPDMPVETSFSVAVFVAFFFSRVRRAVAGGWDWFWFLSSE